MKVDRSRFLMLVSVLAGVPACGSSSTTTGGEDASPDVGAAEQVDAGERSPEGGTEGGSPEASVPACSATNPTGPCVEGTCLNGACCANPCAAQCCAAGALCVQDGAGNKSCATACTDSTQCPASAPCCGPGSPAAEGTLPSSWACLPSGFYASGEYCRCSVSSSCSSGACAPLTDSLGNPVGPLVCKANDGAPYDGCHGALTSCGGAYCCVTDTNANEFCALPCANASNCGAAKCNAYSFANTTCSGPTACGP
jgi:hypothetical protein